MPRKQIKIQQDLVSLSVRIDRSKAERLKLLAEAEHRTVAHEMRRLIDERISAASDSLQEAA